MTKKSNLILLILIKCFSFFAQDYSDYYKKIDSAKYYSITNNLKRADVIFQQCFDEFLGFEDDLEFAIKTHYKINNKIFSKYIYNLYCIGLTSNEIKKNLSLHKIKYSKQEYKKEKQESKKHMIFFNQKKSILIYRMILRDIYYRKKGNNKKTIFIDSLNSLKLIELIKSNPIVFCRFRNNYISHFSLDILLVHSEWKNLHHIQKELHNLVKKGWINRDIIADMIERTALFRGVVFELKNDSINTYKSKIKLCGSINENYSALNYKYKIYKDTTSNSCFYRPFHPNLSIEKVDSLRNYIFFPKIEYETFFHENPKLIILDEQKFCEYIKKTIK